MHTIQIDDDTTAMGFDPGDRFAVVVLGANPDDARIASPVKTADETRQLHFTAAEITAEPGEWCGWALVADDSDDLLYVDGRSAFEAGPQTDYTIVLDEQ